MKGFIVLGLFSICVVSAQENGVFPSVCRYGADTDFLGNVRRCSRRQQCPFTSRCEYILGSQGICCNKRPTSTEQCESGAEPLPGVTCGGIMGRSCPNPTRYRCVTNPLIADDLGVCCPRRNPQSECRVGLPLPGVTCGGFRMTGTLTCPRGYECVGEALAWDGPGVCCRKTDPVPLVCPSGQRPTGERCGGWAGAQCSRPRLHECITNPGIPDSEGICCRRRIGSNYCFLSIQFHYEDMLMRLLKLIIEK